MLTVETNAVWAEDLRIARHVVRLLLVAAGQLQVVDTETSR
jgi:hypothetical protein